MTLQGFRSAVVASDLDPSRAARDVLARAVPIYELKPHHHLTTESSSKHRLSERVARALRANRGSQKLAKSPLTPPRVPVVVQASAYAPRCAFVVRATSTPSPRLTTQGAKNPDSKPPLATKCQSPPCVDR